MVRAIVCAMLLANTATAAAEPTEADRARARTLFDSGVAALRAENYPDALAAFEQSWQLNPRPLVMYNIAMCQRALFDYPAAIGSFGTYLEVAAGTTEPEDRLADARTQIAELERLVAQVALAVEPAGARVLVDGREVGTTPLAEPLRVGPGQHVIEVRRDGYGDFRREVAVEQGERVEIVATLTPALATVGPLPVGPSLTSPLESLPEVESEEEGGIATKWWFWTIIGVVVAGAGVTAGVLLWPSDEGPADDWVLHGP
jgi:hypothetical protein